MCDTAEFNAHTKYAEQQTVYISHNMCGTADSLKLTQYVGHSRELNIHTICVVQQTV